MLVVQHPDLPVLLHGVGDQRMPHGARLRYQSKGPWKKIMLANKAEQ